MICDAFNNKNVPSLAFIVLTCDVLGSEPSQKSMSPGCEPGGGTSVRTTVPPSASAARIMASDRFPASLAGLRFSTTATSDPRSASRVMNFFSPAHTCRSSIDSSSNGRSKQVERG
eukprot:100813-Chlamydomonas_euryale.AAC.2